jgi:hypothetical protein
MFTRSPEAAMWFCEYCHHSGPPAESKWIKAVPQQLDWALAAVEQRDEHDRCVALMIR